MGTLNPDGYEERVEEAAGFAFKVVSYRLGDLYYASASNVDPGAVIARAQAATREAAEAEVVEVAQRRLGRTRTFET